MFPVIDLNALLMGLLFGLALSVMIVAFLVYAAITTPQTEEETSRVARVGAWKSASKYEGRRTYLHAAGHDPELYEW